MSIRGLVSVS